MKMCENNFNKYVKILIIYELKKILLIVNEEKLIVKYVK